MSKESQANGTPWRTRLAELNAVSFDKELAWEQLHGRLGGKRGRRKKPAWYWIAAACILALAVVGVWKAFGPVQTANELVAVPSRPSTRNSPAVVLVTPGIKEMGEAHVTARVPVPAAKSLRKASSRVVASIMTRPAGVDSFPRLAQAPLVSIAGPLHLTQSPMIQKEKLNVVHINELGDPPAETASYPYVRNRHFHWKVGREEILTTPSVASATHGIPLNKTKPFSN